MQNIYLCIADDGAVSSPSGNGGGNICTIGGVADSNYGFWPSMTDALSGYVYGPSNFAVQPWAYSVKKKSDNITICCNSTSGRCQKFDNGLACNATMQLK